MDFSGTESGTMVPLVLNRRKAIFWVPKRQNMSKSGTKLDFVHIPTKLTGSLWFTAHFATPQSASGQWAKTMTCGP